MPIFPSLGIYKYSEGMKVPMNACVNAEEIAFSVYNAASCFFIAWIGPEQPFPYSFGFGSSRGISSLLSRKHKEARV